LKNVTPLTTGKGVRRGLAERRSDGIIQVATGGAGITRCKTLKITGRKILASRRNPTVEVDVCFEGGAWEGERQ